MSDSLLSPIDVSLNRRARMRRDSDVQNDRLAGVLGHLPDGVLVCDQDWVVLYANPEAIRLSHLDPAHIGVQTLWEIRPEIIGTPIERSYRDVMRTRQPLRTAYLQERHARCFDVHIFPVEDGIAVHYRDITPLKEAEKLRDEATRKLEEIFQSAADSIFCLDRTWTCTFANDRALTLLREGELVGRNLLERFTRREPFRSHYLQTMEQGIATEFEAYLPAPIDGWVRIHARPLADGMVIFATDITDRKGAELLRDASAARLRQLLETTTDAVVAFDREWNFTFLNRRAREILAPKGEIDGENLWLSHPELIGTVAEGHLREAMDHGLAAEFDFLAPAPLDIWMHIQCRSFDGGVVIFFRDISERRRSEKVLGQQRELLSSIQHTARVATWEIDYATGKITCGAGSYPITGYPLSEVPDLEAFERILLPEYRPILHASLKEAVKTGRLMVQDFQVRSPNGQPLWLEARGIVESADGRPASLRGIAIDITTRKKNEEALLASEARYRVLVDLNPQAIWMNAPDGTVTYANQRLLDYVGRSIETLSGEGWMQVIDPEDRTRLSEIWRQAMSTGDEYDVEVRLLRGSDGAARWWRIRARPVRDEVERIIHWLGVAMEIHDSRTHAETLQQKQALTERQRAELESIYQAAPVGLALFDAKDLRYLRINDRQAEIVGLPKEQILGRVVTDLVPLQGLRELLMTAASGVAIRNQMLEGELPARPGEHRFWNVSYSPVFGAGTEVEAIAAVVVEMTDVKKAEAALRQSEKLAAVGRLASSISHEINNPLEAITNLLYLVSISPELPETVESYVHAAQAELARVCQIATQTLRFHRQAVRATSVTAAELFEAVLHLYQGRLGNSAIHVEAKFASDSPVLCFENDIRQVLNNLIANAIDAMRKGGRLIIRAHEVNDQDKITAGRRGIRLTVADTGHGMPEAVQRRLFEPFYTTKELNGTGLGLWISSGIVSRHKGRLTFRSSQDPRLHGSVFTLFLPLAVDGASENGETQA